MRRLDRTLLIGAVLYYLSARLGAVAFSGSPGHFAFLWLPAGIGLVLCLSADWHALAPIAVASFAANLLGVRSTSIELSGLHILGIALVDAGTPLLAARLLRWRLPSGLQRPADLIEFSLFACLLPALLSGVLLTLSMAAGGHVGWDGFGGAVGMLVLADSIGVLLVYPLCMSWRERCPSSPKCTWRTMIAGLAALGSISLCYASVDILVFLSMPCLLYVALVGRERVAHVYLLLVVTLIMLVSAQGLGPFACREPDEACFLLVSYGFSLALATLTAVLHNRALRALAQARDSWQYRAGHDSLTGLCNRHLFGPLLGEVHKQAHRHQRVYTVAMLDLDRLKTVNDMHGHQAGDQALIALANSLRQEIREGDVAARVGGDEFCVVFPETDEKGALLALSRMRDSLNRQPLFDDEYGMLTISIGLACSRADDTAAEQVVERADQTLYKAKRAGRNHIVLDSESE